MTHEHHHHERTVTSLNKAFILGIALNVAFVVVEFAVGLCYGSMGLLSDAGHNLSDVASLLLAMLAFRLAQAQATPRYTYGYKKSTVLISLLNSVILLIAVGVIVAESIGRMLHPEPVVGGAIAWTAGVGVAINGFTAWLFMKDKDRDLNVKGAYLHMAADALVSVGVLVSGLVISWTGWTIVDPVVGLVVAAVIVASVWSLTHDGVPGEIDVAAIGRKMTDVPGVKAVHHIHVWAISTTENALTAHVVLESLSCMEEVKHDLKDLLNHAGIPHATLEFESVAERCDEFAPAMAGKVGDEFTACALAWVKQTLRDHHRIIFEGNGYSQEWEQEAERRGLPNLKTTPDALPTMVKPENVAFFDKYGVLNEAEVHARYVSKAEQYSKLLNIEANTMVYMARSLYLPALFDYSGDIATSVATKAELGIEATAEKELVKTLTNGINAIYEATADLESNNADARAIEDPQAQCDAYRDAVIPSMEHLRASVDAMEKICGADYWPVPSYNSLLFWV